MGPRSRLTLLLTLAACKTAPVAPPRPLSPSPTPTPASSPSAAPQTPEQRVVNEFERAVTSSAEDYIGLFDFTAVGEVEILLHRYDLWGRLPKLPDDIKAQFAAEDGTPYPAERERKNVGKFYDILARRTVGTGGCTPRPPRTRYGKKLGTYEPLPAGTPATYEALRQKVTGYVSKGGVVSFACAGGKGGIVVLWTERPNARGFDLVTIYDD